MRARSNIAALVVVAMMGGCYPALVALALLPNRARTAEARTAEARELHRRASEKARWGDCTLAYGDDSQIRGLDAHFHATVFLRDVGIKRCLKEAAALDRAWALTRKARAAARIGDCAKVVTVSTDVRALDAEVHATMLLDDVAIRRCLDAATTQLAPPVTSQKATHDPGALFPPAAQPAPPVTPPATP